MDQTLENLQYPIGRFSWPKDVSDGEVHGAIRTILAFPGKIRKAVEGLASDQLDTPYRPDGWTIRQVVHHCADSHMNAYIRFKLALTEDNPVIKPYDQSKWASLQDSKTLPPDISLALLESVHTRWGVVMESMSDADWESSFTHPEYKVSQKLRQAVMMYAWHCEHHLAHITSLIRRMDWAGIETAIS